MSEPASKRDLGKDNSQPGVRRAYLLAELVALVALAGTVLWLAQNYHPRSFLGRGLLDTSLWILVLLVSAWGPPGADPLLGTWDKHL